MRNEQELRQEIEKLKREYIQTYREILWSLPQKRLKKIQENLEKTKLELREVVAAEKQKYGLSIDAPYKELETVRKKI